MFPSSVSKPGKAQGSPEMYSLMVLHTLYNATRTHVLVNQTDGVILMYAVNDGSFSSWPCSITHRGHYAAKSG